MTKRALGWTAAIVLVMATTARAQEPTSGPGLTVCLTFSQALAIGQNAAAVVAELNRIWRPLGVNIGSPEELGETCNRWILVKSAAEAGADYATTDDTAIAWVPFVAGRARRVVFVRKDYALKLIDAFSPGIRPPAITDGLLIKFIGRSLAHELGHILLNSVGHERSGLMRARYGAHDVMRDLPSAYTLNGRQLDRLFGRSTF